MKRKGFVRPLLLGAVMCGAVLAMAATSEASRQPTPAMTARLAAKVPVTGVVRAGNALVAVGDYGTVVRSTDDGKTWKQAAVPVSTLLTAVYFVDDTHGWAVGHGGIVLASSDGGANWQSLGAVDGNPVLLSVFFSDAQRGYVTGAYGTAMLTTDGGQSWRPMKVGSGHDGDLHLNQIFGTRDGKLFIAAESGGAFRSTDRGETWTKLTTGVSGSLWSGLEGKDGEILLLGMSGKVIVSRDGGQSWHPLATGTEQSLTSAVALADGGLVVVGAGGVVLRGKSGSPLALEIRQDRQNLAAIATSAAGATVVAGQLGVERLDGAH
ncbi:YCF48-related protein [Azoarcus sp. KH32C]|uniref:WD40/YVTN/BNR-like repeat-containing protein n=1 Tax=Azoarcus sp. KH32C TaxID=748247 RepID=UPI0002386877|nr:YCF48-related protein [Azoarcus sp. KH32C]BAL25325.1 BNR repeat-containing glycosyl hydrolase [Azoarcus sp. KH32C]